LVGILDNRKNSGVDFVLKGRGFSRALTAVSQIRL
jgi:hypothetical protein